MIKRWYVLIIFLFLALCSLIISYVYEQHKLVANSIVSCVVSPVLYLQHAIVVPIKRYYQYADINTMQKRIELLTDERDALQKELIAVHATNSFIQETQELIRYKKRYSYDTCLLAHIVLRQLNNHEQSMLIDCGSVSGVEKDMVAVYKNALIGKIVEVYPYVSKVVLVTDPACKVAVFCSQTKASGIAEGRCDSSSFAVTHINHFDHLKKDDYIISSGAGLIFPKGFGLGKIKDFTSDGLFYSVTAKPLVEFDRIEYCYVIKKGS